MPRSKPPSNPQGAAGFRLGEVLRERKEKEGSYAALAREITLANREGTPRGRKQPHDIIDRRKLKSLVEQGKGAVLTIDDLYALDHYLERYGEGLADRPLLRKPDLMQALVRSGQVTFLLGSRPEYERGSVSHWDVLAMAEIQRAIGKSEVSVRFDVQTVPIYPQYETTLEALENHAALALLDDGGPSLVCLGSARSNPCAELMKARMLGCPAFEQGDLLPGRTPPFHFVWSPGLDYLFPSHFRLEPQQIRAQDRDAAERVARREASALVTAEGVLVDALTPSQWGTTYGICLAQRRRRGQVWLALLGITGAATFIAAQLANRLATRLNEAPRGQNSDIYWGIVQGSVPRERRQDFFNVRQFGELKITAQEALSPDVA